MMRLDNVVADFKSTINQEIGLVRRDDTNDYVLIDGELLGQEGSFYIYRFTTENEIGLTDSYEVTVKVKGDSYGAVIISIEPTSIMLSFKSRITVELDRAFLTCDPAFLLEALSQRLDECVDLDKGLARFFLEHGRNTNEGGAVPGKKALEMMVFANPVTFVWGPPGSGKTRTLGELAAKFVKAGKRVLMVSQSNSSVDEAIISIKSNFDENDHYLSQGRIIRHGYIRNPLVKADRDCNPYLHAIEQYPLIKEKIESVMHNLSEQGSEKAKTNVLALKKERDALHERIESERCNLVKEAVVVATTVSKATIDPMIYDKNFDVVIFDEASMAYMPQIVFAASLAKEKFICIGDMLQLSPISRSINLKTNVYDYFKMIDDKGVISHQWLVILEEQYRSHPKIAKFANTNFYGGIIKNNESVYGKELEDIVASKPFENQPVVMLDTSGFYASSCRTTTNSRINIVNAVIAVITAVDVYRSQKRSVGIITPYASQARLIRRLLNDDFGKRAYQIDCSTVHQYQGSQRDVIILDTVENYPYEKLGKLTSNKENNEVDKLVNVATTRARGKLIVIGSLAYWKEYANLDNPFLKLMKYIALQKSQSVVAGNELKKYLEKRRIGQINMWDDEDNAAYSFIQDLRFAKEKITIMLSKGENINKTCLEEVIRIATGNNENHLDIEIKVPGPSQELNRLKEHELIIKRDSLPLAIIDDQIVWYGVPDMNRYYELGRDRIREYNKAMIRIKGKKTAVALDEMLEFRNDLVITDRKENGQKLVAYIETRTCPKCGGALRLVSKKHLFTICMSCQSKDYLHYSIMNDFFREQGIVCPIDKGKLTARLKAYGLILRCSEKHYIPIADFFDL